VHNLSTSFVLGYHGCDRDTGERLLLNQPFQPSENTYDWLGSGIYFWEANPDRALEWATDRADRILKKEGRKVEPFVVGAVVDPGFCLDLISSNGIHAIEEAYASFQSVVSASGAQVPENVGGRCGGGGGSRTRVRNPCQQRDSMLSRVPEISHDALRTDKMRVTLVR
jgi:hypothetical protein